MKFQQVVTAALLCALPQALAATAVTVNIDTPFKVATGSAKGSCDSQSQVLNQMLQETTDMANSAGTAIADIIGRQSTTQSAPRMMFMLFDLNGLLGWIRERTKLPSATKRALSQVIGREFLLFEGQLSTT